ncbi:MAG: cell division protein SepF [Clostridia bacterium]|nr:cell division protein SepF [Clostridia bacterium]
MGVFDLFGRSPRTEREKTQKPFATATPRETEDGRKIGPVSVFEPTSYKEVEKIIDALKDGKNAVVHLEKLKSETAIRVIDLLSGAIYALGGGVYEMEDNIFMFSPTGVEIL